jgi:hypothetical protein
VEGSSGGSIIYIGKFFCYLLGWSRGCSGDVVVILVSSGFCK